MNETKFCKIWYEGDNKKSNFGKTWGAMKKEKANASFMETGNGMYVIDIDSKKIPKKYKPFMDKLGEPTVETARGYHYYVDSEFKMKTQQNIFKDPKFKVDIRGEGGLIFTNYWGDDDRVSYKHKGNRLKDKKFKITGALPDEVVTQKVKKPTVERGDVGQMSKKEVKRLVSKLDIKEYSDRDTWMRMLASIYHAGGEDVYKIALKWSKGDAEQFDKPSFDSVWGQFSSGQFGEDISTGTLIHASIGEKQPDPLTLFAPEKGSVVKPKKLTKKEKKKLEKQKKEKAKEFNLLNVEGVMDDDELARQAEEVVLFDGLIAEGYHTVLYGAAGSNKTTISSWACVQMLKEYPEKIVHFWAFDSDRIHNNEIYKFTKREGIDDRFLLITQKSAEYFEEYYNEARDNEYDLRQLVIVIDTYKFITADVNSKSANKKVLHEIKKLQSLGASILTLSHANKDGANFSGTGELSQDTDALMVIARDKDESTGDITTTIKTETRSRFGTPTGGITLMSNGEGVKGAEFHEKIFSNLCLIENKFDSAKSPFADDSDIKKRKDEEAHKKMVDSVKNQAEIDEIIRIIKYLKKGKNGDPLQTTIISEARANEGIGENTVKTLLRKYTGVYWKWKDHKHASGGRPTKKYKLM